jgi:hypothetical protein
LKSDAVAGLTCEEMVVKDTGSVVRCGRKEHPPGPGLERAVLFDSYLLAELILVSVLKEGDIVKTGCANWGR